MKDVKIIYIKSTDGSGISTGGGSCPLMPHACLGRSNYQLNDIVLHTAYTLHAS